ncbi:SRPBCC family protein [Brevibacterium renqingii]|uniref:SRPBCC family protein n=1 Tax=Brevibacterium renqingii TaxID=2776916 RepID=UPI001ADFE4BB|nr:SRPBCC family protein [Brevibacterium renqingii]
MGRTMRVSDSVVIKADALAIWEQVADPRQMPRWSPENTAARTQAPARPLEVGEVFEGSNHRGPVTWVTESLVIDSEPARRFAFTVRRIGPRSPVLAGSNATWSYDFEDLGGATRVTETWTDDRRRWPDWTAWLFDRIVTRGRSFADFQRLNIHRTLMVMKDDFEAGH